MQKTFLFLLIALLSNMLFIPFSRAEEVKLPAIPLEKKSLEGKKDKNYREGEIIVKYKSQEKKQKALEKIRNKTDKKDLELEIKGEIDNFKMAFFRSKNKSTQELLKEFEKDEAVEFAEPNFKKEQTFIPNDTDYSSQWSLNNTGQSVNFISGTADADIDAPEAWDIELNTAGNGVLAVIDNGVDYTHADLINNMWDGSSCVDELNVPIAGGCPYHGWDYEDNDNTPYGITHGNFIANLAAGSHNNASGIAGLSRYNNIKIMALKFDLYLDSELQSIDFAINNGAKVINASFLGFDFSLAEKNAIEDFNGVFVAAAGNYAMNNESTPAYPCNYDLPNIICVASSDQDDELSYFSNYGIAGVDIMAPGENMRGLYDNSYTFGSGTSYATPLVAGATALLYAHSPLTSSATIRSAILQSSDHKASASGEIACGGRRLNLRNALSAIINSNIPAETCSNDNATIFFDQAEVSATVGQTFNIIARVNPGTNEVGGVKLDVSFNPSVLRLDSITRSNEFNMTLSGPTINNSVGTGSIDVGLLTNPNTYITETADVATFNFTALAGATDSPISFATTSEASAHGEYVTFAREGANATITSTTQIPVYRFWSDKNQGHFYTINEEEKNMVINNYDDYIWRYEGIAFYSIPTGKPVYRFWSDKNQHHFYTINEDEKNMVINNYDDYIWRYEGIAYYLPETSSKPIYRFWSDKNQSHFYTANEEEKNGIINNYDDYIWRYEGVSFYAY